ncbi:MAG: nucleotidyltransferase, partial [Chloroflexi bacterium]|nr:nucleotidyltransferase [Chloroflexota bacterium]
PEALRLVKDFLEAHQIPYMVIGGIANAIWGQIRATEDADVKVSTSGMTISEFRRLAEARFKPYRRPWLGRAESSLIISVEVMPGIVTDMLVSVFPYEEQAVKRARVMDVEGIQLPVCTAEDLVVHKAIADRDKDWMDIDGILLRQKGKIDVAYIRNWLRQFGDALEKPYLIKRFNDLYAKHHG